MILQVTTGSNGSNHIMRDDELPPPTTCLPSKKRPERQGQVGGVCKRRCFESFPSGGMGFKVPCLFSKGVLNYRRDWSTLLSPETNIDTIAPENRSTFQKDMFQASIFSIKTRCWFQGGVSITPPDPLASLWFARPCVTSEVRSAVVALL